MNIARHLKSRKTRGNAFVLALLGGWFVFLAPTNLGGPTAYIEVSGHSMDGTYATGDLVVTREQDSYKVGDIVTFQVDNGGKVIHRIIGGDGETGYILQGDNNPDPDPWRPTDADVIGKSWVHLPGQAYLLRLPANPVFAGSMAGLITLLMLIADDWRAKRRSPEAAADETETDPELELDKQLLTTAT